MNFFCRFSSACCFYRVVYIIFRLLLDRLQHIEHKIGEQAQANSLLLARLKQVQNKEQSLESVLQLLQDTRDKAGGGQQPDKEQEQVVVGDSSKEEVEVADIFLLPPALAEGSPLARPISIRGAQFALDCEEARERLKSHLTEGSIQLLGSSSSRGQDTLLMVDGKPINLQYLLKYKVKYHYEKYRYSLRKFFSLKMLL